RHVDTDHTHMDAAAKFTGHVTVTGKACHTVAELMLVDQLNGAGQVRYAYAAQHRAEDFILIDAHLGGDMIEQGAAHPEAVLATLTGFGAVKVTAVHQQFGAFLHTFVDAAADAFACLLRHDGAHFGGGVSAVQNLQAASAFFQLGQDALGRVTHQHGYRDGHATFACRAVGGTDQGVHGQVDVGVRHDDQVILGAAQSLDALATDSAHFINTVGNRGGTHKGHGLHVLVVDQGLNCVFVTLHHVEYAIGQTGFFQQLGNEQAGAGVDRAGFQHKGVTRGDGNGEHPHGHHAREVERGDARDDTQGLAHGPVVDIGADLRGEIAFEQLRNAASKLHNFNTASDFAHCIGQNLAMLGCNHGCQLFLVLVEQGQKVEQHAGAA